MSFLDDTLRVDTNASVLSPGDAFTNSLLFNITTTPDAAESGNCQVCKAPLTFTQHLALTTNLLKRQLMDGKLRDRKELSSVKERICHLDAALKQTSQELVSAKYGGSGAKQEELKRKVVMLISQMKHKIYHEYIPVRVKKERQC